ncbi:transmembrane channel-like protein 7 isoform X1 [Schistocerca cancellata]|uniref:transmembrane channel-like protein 7 isoform X1 n=2 Tax=Schistocerca cancellata TaxID=274614 RepID=UPI002119AD3D|nr:transmembrane channel-like protein 7 isoform X1 [Schistocerca cancellata]
MARRPRQDAAAGPLTVEMSGGERKKRVSRGQGWEEAGSEFYQESYPADVDLEALQRDPSHIATLLPSKQSRAATAKRVRGDAKPTLRRRTSTRSRCHSTARRTSAAVDTHVAMLPDLSEIKSNEERTWEEIMQIKAMPVSMSQKKELKSKLQNADKLRLQGYEQFKWQRRKFWQHFKNRWKETYSKLELWRHSLKKIEGNFGTGVVSYFLFVKWLMFLNCVIFFFLFCFVVLPQLLVRPEDTSNCDGYNSSSSFNVSTSEASVNVLDIIQGTGWMEKTLMFYGFYSNGTLGGSDTSYLYYNLPLAYIAVTLVCFLMSLSAIVKSAAHGFKDRLMEGEGQFYQYCNIVFGGWDYCIHNEKSATIKHKAIFNEIKGCLEAERLEEERQSRSRDEKVRLYLLRFAINLMVLLVLVGGGFLIYFVFKSSHTALDDYKRDTEDFGTIENMYVLLLEYLPSITIVGLNLIVPNIFMYLVTLEKYSPLFVVRITLMRTVLLRLASLAILLVSFYNVIKCDNCNPPRCWETYVGQQLYKLVVMDFVTHIATTFLINFPRMLIAKHFKSKIAKLIGVQEFELPQHVLDIIYSQTLCWLGSFYAPILPFLATVECFLLFYIKKFSCLVNSTPSSTVYRASRSNSMFMFVLLISFLLAVVPVAYSIAEITPSECCGPFRGHFSVWSFVIYTFEQFPSWIRSVLFFFSTAGFAVPAFIVLALCLYYFHAVSCANKQMVMVLKNQLVLEGHDKQFLLNRLSAIIKQQQQQQQEHHKAMRQAEMSNVEGISNAS